MKRRTAWVIGALAVAHLAVTACAKLPQSDLARPQGIAGEADAARSNPDVFFFEDFESEDYVSRFTRANYDPNRQLIGGELAFNGAKSLRITVKEGGHSGASLWFKFAKEGMAEPNELYARYYLRFDDSWSVVGPGGKLPGPAGTYGRAGWGGRKSNGSNGWSARMGFKQSWFGSDFTDLMYYTYHANMRKNYGANLLWNIGNRGSLEKNKWYCIETYVKMNTVGENDGVLRGWVDGYLAMEQENIEFRTTPDLRIEEYWLNFYYGGKQVAPNKMYIYIDNFALSTSRIGTAVGQAN